MQKRNGVLTDVTLEDLAVLKNNPQEFWKDVTKIGPFAFEFRAALEEIEIPSTVTEIEASAFNECRNLKKVKLNEGLVKIGEEAFQKCFFLEEIKFPSTVKEIGHYAFWFCGKLEKVSLPENLSIINNSTFQDCESLKEIEIPDSVKEIGNYAFHDCKKLKKIKLPKNLEKIGVNAFSDCSSVKEITIHGNVKEVNARAFAGCEELEKVNFEDGIEQIGETMFSGCVSLKKISIPDSVKTIEGSAFSGCKNLNKVKLPKNLESIPKRLFVNCEKLEEIQFPDRIEEIGRGAFYRCVRLKSVKFKEGLKKINEEAFVDCHCLEEIEIPDSVNEIQMKAFANCSSLKKVKLSNNLQEISKELFCDCGSIEEIEIPASVIKIGPQAFENCLRLKKLKLNEGLQEIEVVAFANCRNLKEVEFPDSVKYVSWGAFVGINFKHIYIDKKTAKLIVSIDEKKEFENKYLKRKFNDDDLIKYLKHNFRENLKQLYSWKEDSKIKFVPPEYTMHLFPSSEMGKYFLNKNNQRWGTLVKTLKFDTLEGIEKNNSLVDLMKIYYAIGGFSANQGESEKAFEYVLKYVATTRKKNEAPEKIGAEVHKRFSKIRLEEPYNPTFAKFFMKYYAGNPDFMVFRLEDEYGCLKDERDYLCDAHNSFGKILRYYPYRDVVGNEERSLLTPRFVAEHSSIIVYEYVDEGNEILADMVGKYGYSQEQFDHIQDIYNDAKKIQDAYVICADKSKETQGVTFRVLKKDDPLGFILGDITNCCQHIGGAGEACVDDGYLNKNAGFLVFEESVSNKIGKPTGETRILGQAYVWYDPQTKTVCYDNIEIPTKVLEELKRGDKSKQGLSTNALINAVIDSADAIMTAMNRNGVEVKRVTTGKGYNDLAEELEKKFGEPELNPIASHRDYKGYSDAKYAQYLIRTYDQTTKEYATTIRDNKKEINKNLNDIEMFAEQMMFEGLEGF